MNNESNTTNGAAPMQAADLTKLIEAVKASGARLFQSESGDPTNNAQRNLSGRTHYVDADTLRWHKSRVLSTAILADGLLFHITESCALDMNNTKRGKRCVIFDVFGTAVIRPALDATYSTSDAARNASAREVAALDLAAHYRQALASKLYWIEQDAEKIKTALAMIEPQPAANTTDDATRDVGGQTASTHIGFSEYHGKQHIYTGCLEEQSRGTVTEVVAYLRSLEIPEKEESLSWEGSNGRWYSGHEARSLIAGEIAEIIAGHINCAGGLGIWRRENK